MADPTPGYFIIDGWVSRAEMYSLGLQVPNFPTQDDMVNGRLWIRPGNTADIVKPARFVDTPVGTRYAYGGLVWQWPMVNLSPKMVSYIQETYFQPNGSPSDFFFREWSNKLTVQTFNRTSGEWETYHVRGRFADVTNEASPTAGGFTDLMISFTAFEIAPEGPDLTPSVTIPGANFYVGVELDVEFNVQNIGDGESIQDSQWEIAIPTNATFSGISFSYPTTIEYSEDNGSNYSTTPPSPLSNTTNIRGTLVTELLSGEVTDTYTMTLIPTADGSLDVTIVVTTDSDQDDGNNSDTDSVTVAPFTPLAYSPALWFDGDLDVFSDGVGTPAVDTDPVQEWTDQSGNSVTLEQVTGTKQPLYVANAANGHGGLQFDGTDDDMEQTGILVNPGVPFTWYAVIDPALFSAGGEAIFHTNYTLFHQAPINSQDSVGFKINTIATPTEVGASTSDLQILEVQADTGGAGTDIYRDGVLLGNIVTFSIVSSGTLRIAASDSAGQDPFEGIILELLAFDDYLNSTERNLVIDYLKDKYAIP